MEKPVLTDEGRLKGVRDFQLNPSEYGDSSYLKVLECGPLGRVNKVRIWRCKRDLHLL